MKTLPARWGHLLSDRAMVAMAGLGFASGLPYMLVYITQAAWFSDAKVPIETIGLMSEMTLAYKLKFLWAPFLDRYDPPVLARFLGRRRAWILVSQVVVILTLAGVAFGDPRYWLTWTVAFSVALGIAGGTQDLVIDGWRITVAPDERQALMISWSQVGYRIGNLAAGAGALYLADRVGWRASYLCMAVLMTPGMISAFLAPEPESDKTAVHEKLAIGATIVAPFKEMFTRLGSMTIPILLLVAGFRAPGYISNAMAIPLFKSLDYSNTDIATVTKLFGFGMSLGGTFLAGYIVPRIGMMPSLLVGTVAGSASHLSLAWLAGHGSHGGGQFWVFATSVSIDNFAYTFAFVILITYMSTLATSRLAASQFALLTSLCALPGSILAGMSGFMIERLGYEMYFVMTSLIGIPVAILCLFVWHLDARTALEPALGFEE